MTSKEIEHKFSGTLTPKSYMFAYCARLVQKQWQTSRDVGMIILSVLEFYVVKWAEFSNVISEKGTQSTETGEGHGTGMSTLI